VKQLDVMLAVTGITVILIGLFSKPIKKSIVQEPIIAVLIGIAVGPYALGLVDIARWGEENGIIEEAARITLAIGLMGVALRIQKESVRRLWRPVTVLITVGMVGMWLASSALAAWLLGLGLWTALLLGAAITPTDPVVASSIVTGKLAKEKLPLRVRDGLSFEAGSNDGLAYLFVMLAVLMLGHPPGEATSRWLVESVLVGVIGGSVIGCAVGYVAARLLIFAEDRGIIEDPSLLGYTVAFSLLTLGGAALAGADALISVFLAGLVFNLASRERDEEDEREIQEAVAKLFTLPMFVLFGIALPFAEWARIGWPLAALALLVLLLRRPPVIGALYPLISGSLNKRDTAYLAWFGPVGIAAIYYAALGRGHTGDDIIWHATSAVVFASILGHGVTASALTRLYGAKPGPVPPRTRGLDRAAAKEKEQGTDRSPV
jgi:sodium/hydrogen antiporter